MKRTPLRLLRAYHHLLDRRAIARVNRLRDAEDREIQELEAMWKLVA